MTALRRVSEDCSVRRRLWMRSLQRSSRMRAGSEVLEKRFPLNSPSIRVIGFDVHCTWRGGHHGVDALRKPLDAMSGHLLKVVCGTLPFKPGFVPFQAVFEAQTEGGKAGGNAVVPLVKGVKKQCR